MRKHTPQQGLASLIVVLVGTVLIAAMIGAGYWYAKKYFTNANMPVDSADIVIPPPVQKDALPTETELAATSSFASPSASTTSDILIVPTLGATTTATSTATTPTTTISAASSTATTTIKATTSPSTASTTSI